MTDKILHYFWPSGSPFGIAITFIIISLGLVAIWCAVLHLIRLQDELSNIDRANKKLALWEHETNDDNDSDPEDESIQQVAKIKLTELDERLKELEVGIDKDSHIRARIEAVRNLRSRHTKVNLEALQQITLSAERTHNGIELPKQVAGWVMLLGVVGTFIGLSDMVFNIRVTDIESGQIILKDILSNFNDVLSGMNTAFATSIQGMFWALLCGFFAWGVQHKQSKMFHKLENVTVSKLLPATVCNLDDDSILEKVSIKMEHAFEHLEQATDKNQASMQLFTSAQSSLQSMVSDVQKLMENQSQQDVNAAIVRLIETNQLVSQLITHMPNVVSSLDKTNKEIGQGTQRLSNIASDYSKQQLSLSKKPLVYTLKEMTTILGAVLLGFALAGIYFLS